MRRSGWAILVVLTFALAAGCTPRQIRPVAGVDPAPLLEKISARRMTFEKGLSGTLDLSFNGKRRYNSKAYIVAYPDGPFRLEIPAPLGGTALAIVSVDGEILAYYPEKGRAYRTTVDGRSISPFIPFPLPVDLSVLPSLIMGVSPAGAAATDARAWRLDSGDELLKVRWGGDGPQFTYLFGKRPEVNIKNITIRGRGVKVVLNTVPGDQEFPGNFTITLANGTLKGHWESVALFRGDRAALDLHLPHDVPVTDLEAKP